MRRYIFFLLIGFILLTNKTYGSVKFSSEIIEYLDEGVTYKYKLKIVGDKVLGVHILNIPITNDTVRLKTITNNKTEFGQRDTVKELLSKENAIAGINGSFFDLGSNIASPYGMSVNDKVVTSANNTLKKDTFASFFITEQLFPYIAYPTAKIKLYSENGFVMDIAGINKIGSLNYTSYYNSDAIDSTKNLGTEVDGRYKILVSKNNIIKAVVKPYEHTKLDNGDFVVILSDYNFKYHKKHFIVGKKLKLEIDSNIKFENTMTGLSGGGILMYNGKKSINTGLIPYGRHPRTTIGITEDRKNVLLVVVDGRNYNLGATEDELIRILQEENVVDALNLDGGGSATMVTKDYSTDELIVVNNISDLTSRKVADAIGVFTKPEYGDILDIIIEFDKENYFKDEYPKINVYGLDKKNNRVPLDRGKIAIKIENKIVTVIYIGENRVFLKEKPIIFKELYGIEANEDLHILSVNPIELSFFGLTEDNFKEPLHNATLKFEVSPKDLAVVNDGVLEPLKKGTGYLKVEKDNIVSYQKITIGFEETDYSHILSNSRTDTDIGFSITTYPINYKTYAKVIDLGNKFNVLELNYNFKKNSKSKQTAYINISGVNIYNENAYGIQVDLVGDNSKNKVYGTLIDSNGRTYNLYFSNQIDFSDKKTLIAKIPPNIKKPFMLKSIYVTNERTTNDITSKLEFSNLKVLSTFSNTIEVPEMQEANFSNKVSYFKKEFLKAPEVIVENGIINIDSLTKIINISNENIQNYESLIWDEKFRKFIVDNIGIIILPDFTKEDLDFNNILDTIIDLKTSNVILFTQNDFSNIKEDPILKILNQALSITKEKNDIKNLILISNNSKNTPKAELFKGISYLNFRDMTTMTIRFNENNYTYTLEKGK